MSSFLPVALLAVGFLAAMLGLQRRVMYPRPALPAVLPQLPVGAETVWLGDANDVEAWLLPATAASEPYPAIIFAHGNGELIDYWVGPFADLTAAGIGVLLVEYPSYGRSGGRPTQETITGTMVGAYDFLSQHPDVDADRIVAHGRSLGGGAACALSTERPLAGLVLESTFTSVAAVAPWYLPRALVLDPFDNLAAVAARTAPTLVLHGERDQVIPHAHGEQLASAAGTKLVSMTCGHNDCPRPWPDVLRFFEEHGITR